MKNVRNFKTLGDFPVGARLLVRTRESWGTATVCQFVAGKVVLSICSSSGRTYRLRRDFEATIVFDGFIPILKGEIEENWRENFTKYDFRW
jgi:hypothetical protein